MTAALTEIALGLAFPEGPVMLADGSIAVVEIATGVITRIPRDVDFSGLYYAKADGSFITELVYPMIMPNGVGLSTDQKTVYVAETRTGHLWAFDIMAPGQVRREPPHENGGHHLAGPAGFTSFDSLAVESGGNI